MQMHLETPGTTWSNPKLEWIEGADLRIATIHPHTSNSDELKGIVYVPEKTAHSLRKWIGDDLNQPSKISEKPTLTNPRTTELRIAGNVN